MAQRIEDEEYSPLGEHVVEIPARGHAAEGTPHRSFAALGVAAFLTLAGITVVVGVVEEHAARERDERAQRDDLREGWQALSTVAAEGAANEAMQPAVSEPNAQPTVVVVPLQVSPPSTPITVNQPLPASTAQMPAPQNGATMNAPNGVMNGALPSGVIPTPVPFGGNIPTQAANPMNGTPMNGAGVNGAAVNGAAALNGNTPLNGAIPPAPVGATPATNPNQPLPSNVTPPAGQSCGILTCELGSVCCNASCGICTPPGVSCSQLQCG